MIKKVNIKNAIFCLLTIVILLNAVYFSSQFMAKSQRYENHGFTTINDALDNLTDKRSLVFANNYIYMRPYISDKIFEEGLLLPPPDTEAEFLKLLQIAPNNTLFLISNDSATTWYEYGNKYIKSYAGNDIITSDKPDIASLLKLNLSDVILHMTFDDANDTVIPDDSASKNNGLNNGAQIVEGYSGKALRFNGKEYVTIPNNDTLNIQNAITISFLASIETAEPGKGYVILSKGYAPINGSYDIFIYDSKIYFELSDTNYIAFPIGEYLGEWHHFIFTYDGEKMEGLIDGVVVATKSATGAIKNSNYDIEIGRDSERKICYFNGTIDELQLSGEPLNITELTKTYLKHYAIKIQTVTENNGDSSLFKTANLDCENDGGNVRVDNLEMALKSDLKVKIDLKITSDFPTNTTILISTDRFTKVYVTNLTTGTNNVTFEYPYIINSSSSDSGGPYWLHLTQTRVTIVVGETIIYNGFISPLIPTLINIYLMLIAGIVLTIYLIITYISRNRFDLP